MFGISIHALREEGDEGFEPITQTQGEISIHALREEGDLRAYFRRIIRSRFLSTPSARRATSAYSFFTMQRMIFLSTPSARRAT